MQSLRGEFEIVLDDATPVRCLMNMYAIGTWCEENEKAISDIQSEMQKNPLVCVPRLTWAGVRCYYMAHDKEPPMSFGRFAALLGSTDWTDLAKNINNSLSLLDSTKKKRAPRKS